MNKEKSIDHQLSEMTHQEFYRFVSEVQTEFVKKLCNKKNRKKSRKFLKRRLVNKSNFDQYTERDVKKKRGGKVILHNGEIINPLSGYHDRNEYEFEYTNEHTDGFWDLRIKHELLDEQALVEYKSSIKEMPLDDILIQIKKRVNVADEKEKGLDLFGTDNPSYPVLEEDFYRQKNYNVFLVSFDKRFEKYRRVLFNEDIYLLILDLEDFEYLESIPVSYNTRMMKGGVESNHE